MAYRREIDGLRAFAVLPVIFFHAGFELFSGGFVGVDIFFVISGYLITLIIISELNQGRFSLINFYERRIRRILPALFFMMLVCIPIAWLVLLPEDMKSFSKSLIAVSIFSSNVLFWQESGYFDIAAELKPLLHTWSLAVEEQYYLLFPLFLMWSWRFGKLRLIFILSILLLSSLLFAHWVALLKPTFAFYLLPTRAWELLIGALTAFYMARDLNKKIFNRYTSEIAALIGLLLLFYSIFSYDKNTPFPSFYALVPTIGTALILLFATSKTLIGRLMGNKVFVGIGLISYSAYLWHQPLFAFARYKGLTQDDNTQFLVLIFSSLFLAYLSWKFIEIPFRDKKKFNKKQVFVFAILGCIFFIAFGLLGKIKNGDIWRLNVEQKRFLANFENELPAWNYFTKTNMLQKYRDDCNFYDIPNYRIGRETKVALSNISSSCYISDNSKDKIIFIWGDSHAQQLYYGLNQVLDGQYDILQVASSGCVASLHSIKNHNNYCEYSNWFAWDKLQKIKPKFVIIGQNDSHNIENMKQLSDALLGIGVEKVIFTGPTPHWSPSLPTVVAFNSIHNPLRHMSMGLDKAVLQRDTYLKENFFADNSISYVSLIDYFCIPNKGCLVYFGDNLINGITSWDYGHLTPISSYNFAKDVLVKSIRN
jgi:peptidoglycan/LPS O-acetylase OafA/YrhL